MCMSESERKKGKGEEDNRVEVAARESNSSVVEEGYGGVWRMASGR